MLDKYRYLFEPQIWSRGKKYYEEGKIVSFNSLKGGTEFRAVINGSDSYYITHISNITDDSFSGSCTCPYESLCKHQVALLYKIEEKGYLGKENLLSRKVGKLVKLDDIGWNNDNRIHYFNLDKIFEELYFIGSEIEEAKKAVEEKKIEIKAVELYYYQEELTLEFITVSEDKETTVIVTKDKIRNIFCTCHSYGYSYNNKKCTHKIPALLLLADYIRQNNPGDDTNQNANSLFRFLEQKSGINTIYRTETSDLSMPVELEPKVVIENQGIGVGFKIGNKKKVQVRNIEKLINAVENKEVYEASKTMVFDFSKNVFEEKSEALYRIVSELLSAKIQHNRLISEGKIYDDRDKIGNVAFLSGEALDSFFDLYKESALYFENRLKYNYEEKEVSFSEKPALITLNAKEYKDKDNNLNYVEITGYIPEVFRGTKFCYTVNDNVISRYSKESFENISQLEKIADYRNFVEIRIGRKKILWLMNHLLPWLKSFCIVNEKNLKLSKLMMPEESGFKFVLDREQGIVTLSATSFYDKEVYDVGDYYSGLSATGENRDGQKERLVVATIEKYFDFYDSERKKFTTDDEEKIFELLDKGLPVLMEFGEVNLSESFKTIKIYKSPKIKIGVSVKSGLLDLTVSSEDVDQKTLLEILAGMKTKKKFFRLTNGQFFSGSDAAVQELENLIDTLHISHKDLMKGKISMPLARSLYLDKILEENETFYSERDKKFKSLVKDIKTIDDSDYEIPDEYKGVMRNYQEHGHKWLRTLSNCGFGGILADDMGLGKTLQAISMITAEKKGTSLIVTPASLVYNWVNEFAKFSPQTKVAAVSGTSSERDSIISCYKDYDVLVTSYDLLKRDIEKYNEAEFYFEIIDEGQYIKNATTQSSKSVKAINAKHRFALTGTPIENRLSELWSIFDFLMPGFLFSYEDFKKRFEMPIVKSNDEKAMSSLRKMVSPFILRRLKEDVLKDLPDKTEEIIYAKFEKEQQQLYDAQVLSIRKMVETQDKEEFKKTKLKVLSELMRIRQICCDPSLVYENYKGDSAKKQTALDLINSGIEGGHKILLFSQFTSMLEILENELSKNGISYYKITGSTSKEKRMELVESFNKDDTPVFLISLKAGGTGLNLTGADIVIHYDPWWNLAVQNQATDRAHRIGQTKKVTVYKIISKDSIEEKILEMQNKKNDLADEILSGENGNFASLSKEDFLEILG